MADTSKIDCFEKLAKLEKEEAILKWFSPYRGYGFVKHPQISEDIFVHFSVIDKSGHKYLDPGDKLICDIAQKHNGYQVTEIYEVERTEKPEYTDPSIEVSEGFIKWFNPMKGFGFAWSEEKKEDVFVHASILKRIGLPSLAPGCKIIMKIRKSQNGLEALDIMLT